MIPAASNNLGNLVPSSLTPALNPSFKGYTPLGNQTIDIPFLGPLLDPAIPPDDVNTKQFCKKRTYFDGEGSAAVYVLLDDIRTIHGEEGADKWKSLAGEQECFVIPGGDVSHNLPDNQLGIPYSVYEKYNNLL